MGKLSEKTIAIAAAAAAAAVVLFAGEKEEESRGCEPDLLSLTPGGSEAEDFTMGIRVNQPSDVDEISESLGDRIQPRDVFVVNTSFAGSRPADWKRTTDEIAAKYPCNRLAALNGLGGDEDRAGYAFALAGEPGVDAVLVDWEEVTYDEAPGPSMWSPRQKPNIARVGDHLEQLAPKMASDSRMGLVPQYLPGWDYGAFGAVVAARNKSIGSDGAGFQLIQTQTNCNDPEAPGPGVEKLVKNVVGEYGRRAPVGQYGFEIAFSTTPVPGSNQPVDRVSPSEAATCSQQIIEAGGAGILYWATPASLEAMLRSPDGRRLRP